MPLRVLVVALSLLGGSLTLAAAPQPPEVVAQAQVQGNTITPDADVLAIAGITVGMPLAAGTIDAAAGRLTADGRFDRVQVLKRFASIADPSQIVLVVIVHEPGAAIQRPGSGRPAGVGRRRGPRLQYWPILGYDDGYGWTYGVQVARPNLLGSRSRLSFPVSWGGERKAGAVLDKTFVGPLTRVEAGGALTRRVHPFFDEPENRRRIWLRGERQIGRTLRLGATADWQRVALGATADDVPSLGADLTLDTRVDPWLARNAVLARASWRRARFPGGAANLTELEARGYLPVVGQAILVVRAEHDDTSVPVPSYAEWMIGGTESVRGFAAGSRIGDTRMLASIEARVPLNSALRVAKVGVNVFVDTGAAYAEGERLRDQPFREGVGGGVWFSAAVMRVTAIVAHGVGGSTRVQFGVSSAF
jgi:outer membrane protein assembly factor BamA